MDMEDTHTHTHTHNLPGRLDGKESTYNAGNSSSSLGSGRYPGGGHGNPLQCSCLENPMDRGQIGYSPWDCKESDLNEAT